MVLSIRLGILKLNKKSSYINIVVNEAGSSIINQTAKV